MKRNLFTKNAVKGDLNFQWGKKFLGVQLLSIWFNGTWKKEKKRPKQASWAFFYFFFLFFSTFFAKNQSGMIISVQNMIYFAKIAHLINTRRWPLRRICGLRNRIQKYRLAIFLYPFHIEAYFIFFNSFPFAEYDYKYFLTDRNTHETHRVIHTQQTLNFTVLYAPKLYKHY